MQVINEQENIKFPWKRKKNKEKIMELLEFSKEQRNLNTPVLECTLRELKEA